MSCSQWEQKLALYAGGDLAFSEAPGVESHLRECPDCRIFLDRMNQSLALLQTDDLDLPAVEAMHRRTMLALQPASHRYWRYAAAAAVVMLSGYASWFWTPAVPALPAVQV